MTQNSAIKLFLILLGTLLAFTYGSSIFILATHHMQTDLTLTYLSGKMLNSHIPAYHLSKHYQLVHHLKKDNIPNLSPPFSIMFAAIAAKYLSLKSFFMLFMTTTVCINIFALSKLYQHMYPEKKTHHWLTLYAFILLNLIYMPTFANISFGQVALLLNALIIFTYLALERKKEVLAGCLLALAINIKLFFGIFVIFLLAQKHYRALSSFIIFSAILALTPIFIYGFSIYTGYFSALSNVTWYGVNWNASFYGFLSRLLGDTNFKFHTLFSFPGATKLCYYLIFCTYFVLTYFVSRKDKYSSSLAFAFTLSSMLLISPLGWNYYFPILVTALLINLKATESNRYYPLFISLLLFSLFLSALPFPIYRDYKTTAIVLISQGNTFFFSLILLNVTNFLQLTLPLKGNTTPIFSKKLTAFVICLCLAPSFIGVSSISFGNFTHKYLNTKDHHA